MSQFIQYSTIFALFLSGLSSLTCTPEPVRVLDTNKIENFVFNKTNELRRKYDLPPFKKKIELLKLARYHSRHMVEQNFFAHVDRDNRGSVNRWFHLFPGYLSVVRENIGYNSGETEIAVAENLVEKWMKSEIYRKNILNEKFRFLETGIIQKENRYYATQNFLFPVAKMTVLHPVIEYKTTPILPFFFEAEFPCEDLRIIIEFPNKNTQYKVDDIIVSTGAAPVEPVWITEKRFQIKFNFKYGRGTYIIKMGQGNQIYNDGIALSIQ